MKSQRLQKNKFHHQFYDTPWCKLKLQIPYACVTLKTCVQMCVCCPGVCAPVGTISVADDLDFEVCKDYYLTIEAWDSGTPPLSSATMVTVELMDVNDNAPAFSEDIYNVLVSEDASIGQTITRVTRGSFFFFASLFFSVLNRESM